MGGGKGSQEAVLYKLEWLPQVTVLYEPMNFFFLLNQGSWKNFKELKSCWADKCADMAERPAEPRVALWA